MLRWRHGMDCLPEIFAMAGSEEADRALYDYLRKTLTTETQSTRKRKIPRSLGDEGKSAKRRKKSKLKKAA